MPTKTAGRQRARRFEQLTPTPGTGSFAAMQHDARNDELFREALTSLRETESAWREQIEFALGHPAALTVDYDSLGGRYELVQPFVHQAVAGTIQALAELGFDPARGEPLRAAVSHVVIAGDSTDACDVTIANGVLTARVALDNTGADAAPAIEAAIRDAIYHVLYPDAPRTPSGETSAEVEATEHGLDAGRPRRASLRAAGDDTYERATALAAELEVVMRDVGLWPGERPKGPIEIRGAFGSENMSFGEWLAWVLIPRLHEIVRDRGEFPSGSNLAAYAIRALDGFSGQSEVRDVLDAIDELGGGDDRTA
jgi:uncharacterized protein YqcC (DUF446 family)